MSILTRWKRTRVSKPSPISTTLTVGVQTDAGCVRENNEDTVFFRAADDPVANDRGALVIVADGMGGHSGGEVASKTAVDTVDHSYYASWKDTARALVKAFTDANAEIRRLSESKPELRGMGTTCTALAIRDGCAHAAHVGDSRLYLIRGNAIYRMTEDDSIVMEMLRDGLITREQAENHEDRNVLLKAMGVQPKVDVSSWKNPLALDDGDRFVLCTDGLHDLVREDEIKELAVAMDPSVAAAAMIALARERGGYDNISVAVVKIGSEQQDSKSCAPVTRIVDAGGGMS